VDTDRSVGNKSLDTIYVDDMYITSVSGGEYYFDEISEYTGGSDSGWQDSPTYEDTDLQPETTYTYRVKARDKSDNKNENDWSLEASTTTPTSALPGQATYPTPSDGQSDVNRKTVTLNWTAGSGAASHDVYMGTNAELGPANFIRNQTSTSYKPSVLRKGITYYWRIDEVNSDGTTTGVVWNFTTL